VSLEREVAGVEEMHYGVCDIASKGASFRIV
jgi:hypothetical protein